MGGAGTLKPHLETNRDPDRVGSSALPETVDRTLGVEHADALRDWADYYPSLTQAAAGVALVVFSFLLLQVASKPDPNLLAEIDSYRLEAPANPFLPQPTGENPFLSEFTTAGNPFQAALRSEK